MKNKEALAILFLCCSILFKEVAVIALPFYALRMKRKNWLWLVFIIPCLGLILYGHPFPQLQESIRFWKVASSNGSLSMFIPRDKNTILLWIFLTGGAVLLKKFWCNPIQGIHYSLAWLLMVSPCVHPWYLTWILVFTGITRFKAWWLLSGTMFFYFLSSQANGVPDLWSGLRMSAIYVPFQRS